MMTPPKMARMSPTVRKGDSERVYSLVFLSLVFISASVGLVCFLSDAEISLAIVADVDPYVVLASLCPGLFSVAALADDGSPVDVHVSPEFH